MSNDTALPPTPSDPPIVQRLTGEGWLFYGLIRIGQVSYEVDLDPLRGADPPLTVRLGNHSLHAASWRGLVLTLLLDDGRRVTGFLHDDGVSLSRAYGL